MTAVQSRDGTKHRQFNTGVCGGISRLQSGSQFGEIDHPRKKTWKIAKKTAASVAYLIENGWRESKPPDSHKKGEYDVYH
jgi:hypothetical protein